jgi:fused signal recognition particle receptor
MFESEVFFWIMSGTVLLGVFATIGFYFFRYTVKEVPGPRGPTSMKEALAATRGGLWGRLRSKDHGALGLEQIEEALYTSDIGPQTAQAVFEEFSRLGSATSWAEESALRKGLGEAVARVLRARFKTKDLFQETKDRLSQGRTPEVWMIVGVNGVGKTTTIGKLAKKAVDAGLKVLVVAADTYRAAADSQLKVWSERSGAEFFSPQGVTDPAAVAYSGLEYAKSKDFALVLVDTAGRLHTQENLMEELKKTKRVMSKVLPEAPVETLIVLDANNGQNALVQAKKFHDALTLTGVVMTKMDGTAKGGVLVGVVNELGLAIPFIGIGEQVTDLRPFSVDEFVDAFI